jgi:O-antigen/teichoic acid export membrane protein
MVRFKANDPKEMTSLKNTAFLVMLKLCVMLGAGFYACSHFFLTTTIIAPLAVWLLIHGFSDMLSMVPKVSLRFNQRAGLFSLARALRVVIMVFVLLSMVRVHRTGLVAIITAEAVAAAVECILCFAFDKYIPSAAFASGLGPLLGLGIPMTAVTVGIFLNDLSDRYVVYLLLGEQANGFYAAAAKIALAGSFCAEAFNAMWFPYYFRFAQRRESHEKELRDFSNKLLLIFAALIGFLCICLPQLITLRLFGRYFVTPAYHGVAVVVAPLTLAYFFKMAVYVPTPIITYQKRIWKLSLIMWVAVALNIVANIFLIKMFGASHLFTTLTAIALMTSLSYGLCMVWTSHEAKLFQIREWFFSQRSLFCAALLAPAFLPVPIFYQFGIWIVLASILYWRQFSNSNIIRRMLTE